MHAFRNGVFHGLGLASLAMVSMRHRLSGYRTPSRVSASDWPRAIDHVVRIVEDWRRHLVLPDGRRRSLRDRDVLELGPGANLGTGLLLLGLGARSYLALDRYDLASGAPLGFYRALVTTRLPRGYDRAAMRAALASLETGAPGPIALAADPDFDILRGAGDRRFDLVVSNAAFEHFDDIERVVAQLDCVTRPGASLVAGVDFQTHTRGVRRRDPNGIYRFSPDVYRTLSFPGQPNRRRPLHYVRALRKLGWCGVTVRPVDVADPRYLAWSRKGLAPAYRGKAAQMQILTGIVRAEKGAAPTDPVLP